MTYQQFSTGPVSANSHRDDEQHRAEDRGDLHHIKGNIYFFKNTHIEELLHHRQSHLHRVNRLSCTEQTLSFALHRRTSSSNNSTETTHFRNDRTVQWTHFHPEPLNLTTNKNLDHLQTRFTTWLVKINCLQSCQNARDVHRSFLSPSPGHRLHLFECVHPDEWNVFCCGGRSEHS